MTKQNHNNTILLKNVEEEIRFFILKIRPDLTVDSKITFPELLNYRLDYIKQMISTDSGKMEELNETIVKSIKENTTITDKLNPPAEKKLTTGQKMADGIAKFGGSWPFIFIFIIVKENRKFSTILSTTQPHLI